MRCIIIAGPGRGFCAGQDLSDNSLNAASGPADLGDSLERHYPWLIRIISGLDKPVICALMGWPPVRVHPWHWPCLVLH